MGSYEIQSDPSAAEVYVDGAFVGNTPATLKLKPGQHVIRISLNGYKDWSHDLTVQEGSEAHIKATLEKQQ
jgi:predicted acylesterase/phospholipase RssA